MRGVYYIAHKITGVTAGKTLFYATAPSGRVIEVLGWTVTVLGETNEQLELTWQDISTLGTPTATSKTPTPTEDGDQAAAGTYAANVTASEPTYSSNTETGYEGAASLAGYRGPQMLDERFTIQGSTSKGLRLLNTIASNDVIICIRVKEIG